MLPHPASLPALSSAKNQAGKQTNKKSHNQGHGCITTSKNSQDSIAARRLCRDCWESWVKHEVLGKPTAPFAQNYLNGLAAPRSQRYSYWFRLLDLFFSVRRTEALNLKAAQACVQTCVRYTHLW